MRSVLMVVLPGVFACSTMAMPGEVDPPPATAKGACQAVAVHDADALAVELEAAFAAAGHDVTVVPAGRELSVLAGVSLGATPDPGAAALALLTSLPGGPFAAGDLVAATRPDGVPGRASVDIRRVRAGAVATPFEGNAVSISLQLVDDAWKMSVIGVDTNIAYVTESELAALAACAASTPAEATVRAHEFAGATASCTGNGDAYTYTAQPGDTVTVGATPSWRALDEDGGVFGAPTQWHVLFPAQLLLAPANFGLLPTNADCRCDDRAGFDLQVSSANDILLVRPGLGCVSC